MRTPRRFVPAVLALIVLIVPLFAGCSSAAPAASPTPSSPPQSADPSQPANGDPGTPVGTDAPPGGGAPGVIDPVGRVVTPKPGQLDVRPISAQSLSAAVDGHRVVVTIAFTSGVAPCHVLDSIVVARGDASFAITLREGHGPGDVACIEIAEFLRAIVDLGDLPAGTYTISDATGGAAPISVTVS